MHFLKARYSQYRVWCLKELQDKYHQIPQDKKEETRKLLTIIWMLGTIMEIPRFTYGYLARIKATLLGRQKNDWD